MYGNLYTSTKRYFDLFTLLDITLKRKTNAQNTNYYYSDSVTYANGIYTLVNPTKSIYKENYRNLDKSVDNRNCLCYILVVV